MSDAEVFEVQCGECDADFQIESTDCGTTVHCPNCESPADIPTLAEILGDEPESAEPEPAQVPAATPAMTDGIKAKRPKPPSKKGSATDEPRQAPGRSKSKSQLNARRNAQFLLKLSPIFYYIACFVAVAWTIRVVGMLYPIVNSKKGSYWDWFMESIAMSAWTAALIGLLIAVAELIKVIVNIQETVMAQDSGE